MATRSGQRRGGPVRSGQGRGGQGRSDLPGGAPGESWRGLHVQLENFDGPLDLLLFLIRREEVSIYDIPIARITEQFLYYIQDLSTVDFDRAADYLVMAAQLMDIKSRWLLPRPQAPDVEGEETLEDPRAELVRKLELYQQFKAAAETLKRREEEAGRSYGRGWFPEHRQVPAPLTGVDLADLVAAFQEVLQQEWSWREVPREEVPLRERMREINWRLTRHPEGIRFRDLFTGVASRLEVVVTFIAMLELIRMQRAVVVQERPFGEIMIRRNAAAAAAPPLEEGP